MPGHVRLGLAHQPDQVAHGTFAVGEEADDLAAATLGDCVDASVVVAARATTPFYIDMGMCQGSADAVAGKPAESGFGSGDGCQCRTLGGADADDDGSALSARTSSSSALEAATGITRR